MALRRSTERRGEAVLAPEIGMEFDSLTEAYDFYNLYSWEIGFGIKYGPSNKNRAGIKTVQNINCGCEGRPGSSMNMFVRHYQKLQFDRDAEENFQDMRNRLGGIEMHASKIYTPNVFGLFETALFQSGSYILKEVVDGHRFIVKHIFAEKRETWSRTEYEVTAEPGGEFFKCQCGTYEHMGILCAHALSPGHDQHRNN